MLRKSVFTFEDSRNVKNAIENAWLLTAENRRTGNYEQ